jgi:hypothetical protein
MSGQSGNGTVLELAACEAFRRIGWAVELTAASGDFGADIIAEAGSERMVIQCKDYVSPVGIEAVQQVCYAMIHYNAHLASVVARTGYTAAALEAGRRAGVYLLLFHGIERCAPLVRNPEIIRLSPSGRRIFQLVTAAIDNLQTGLEALPEKHAKIIHERLADMRRSVTTICEEPVVRFEDVWPAFQREIRLLSVRKNLAMRYAEKL